MSVSEHTDVSGRWNDPEVTEAVRSNPFWYHTMELRPRVVTPGWFDLRPVLDLMPWPDVRGKRCLDIGTYDGALAFELERRGASEVVATDIPSHGDWDFAPARRQHGIGYLEQVAGEKGRGFEIAARALGSSVQRRLVNVYDLSPDTVGVFDVVVCGSLLLHLRDPLRALEAIRSVCTGWFLSAEEIDLPLTVLHPRRALTRLGPIGQTQWHVPNLRGHRLLVSASGFAIGRAVRPYAIPFGVSHPPPRGMQARAHRRIRRLIIGGSGVPHSALLARPV